MTHEDAYLEKLAREYPYLTIKQIKHYQKEAQEKMERDHRAFLNSARREGVRESSALINALLDAGRIDDLRRAATDEDFCEKLLEELGLASVFSESD